MGISFNCNNQPDRLLNWGAKKVGNVFITARSLFLNENVGVHAPNDALGKLAWNFGTYSANLKLDDATLKAWKGKQLLDVGGGASIFPEEADLTYGIKVTTLDLNVGRDAPYLDTISINIDAGRRSTLGLSGAVDRLNGKAYLRQLYARNLEWLWCNYQAAITNDPGIFPAFQNVFGKRYSISQSLFTNSNRRVMGDAQYFQMFPQDTFDIITSVWVFNYLDNRTKKRIIGNMVDWLKPHGEIRIFGGQNIAEGSNKDSDLTPANFRRMFQSSVYGAQAFELVGGQWPVQVEGRYVYVAPRSDDKLLILKVKDKKRTG